jgi:hypothetical protein
MSKCHSSCILSVTFFHVWIILSVVLLPILILRIIFLESFRVSVLYVCPTLNGRLMVPTYILALYIHSGRVLSQ